MIKVFTGWDEREAIGYGTFIHSVISRASRAVSFTPLHGDQRDGSNAFTYARFEVPRLCDYSGWAIFADGCDMICKGDIAELYDLRDESFAVQVVKHKYKTNGKIKYLGTEMECPNVDYARKNWSSLILWNCEHPANREITNDDIQKFRWLEPSLIGELPMEWNWLVDEYGPKAAKLLHWTQGIPAFHRYRNAYQAEDWLNEHRYSQRGWQNESATLAA